MTARRSLLTGGLGALLLTAAWGAEAQDNSVIGPPQLKDFSLEPARPVVTAPPAQTPAPPVAAPAEARPVPAPATRSPEPAPTTPPPAAETRRTPNAPVVDRAARAVPEPAAPGPVGAAPGPASTPVLAPPSDFAPAPSEPAAESPIAPAAPPASSGPAYWLYALPAAALALLGFAAVRRRRRSAEAPVEAPAAAAPPPPRPDPVPRPWLELSLKAERAAFTDAEAEVQFELEIANKGGSAARDLRIDVKMFNAGAEQDKEIGSFFRTAGRDTTRLRLPVVEAGVSGVIRGTVGMPREAMRAMRLDDRLLFIPVVAVNALYDWGENRTGQTGRSWLVGREAAEPSEKMGAFRVDQGPRIWRTVGQRQHKVARRV